MKKIYFSLFVCNFLLFVSNAGAQIQQSFKINSPDKLTRFELAIDETGKMKYRVLFSKSEITSWSELGFTINGVTAGQNTLMAEEKQNSVKEEFAWPLGENDIIQNHFNVGIYSCQTGKFMFNLDVRVFNNSVAFRYRFPQQPGFEKGIISGERTSFNFPENLEIYQYQRESVFTPVSLDKFTGHCDLPATLTGPQKYISIGEANNRNYTKVELKKGEKENGVSVDFFTEKFAETEGAFSFPWRTISFSRNATGLHHCSELNLKLTPPSPEGIPGWISPGKLIRIMKLDTESGMECIDFAVKNNFRYVMYDGGWYNVQEFDKNQDYIKPIPAIDVQKVAEYGKRKNVGLILYVNYSPGLVDRLDSTLLLFKRWGVAGIKPGFVDGCRQKGIQWLVGAVHKMQSLGFIINVHDSYKPTGLSRSYPALLTQEGIRGDENGPDAFHNMVLPYTRFLAGPADFTFCYPNASNKFTKQLKVSMGQQLALTVVYFSPLQAVFWYGRPGDYKNEQEIEFFKHVPTVWNESHYLAGEIGKNICVARRNGSIWYVGIGTGMEAWKSKIKLGFLKKGIDYIATVYEDDVNGSISKRTIKVKKGDIFPVDLQPRSGKALMISVNKNAAE
jgi:alpha-glucosidase